MFRIFVIGLVAGLVVFYQLRTLPGWLELAALSSILLSLNYGWRRIQILRSYQQTTRTIIAFLWGWLLGFCWALCHFFLTPVLPNDAFQQKTLIEARIIDLPQYGSTLSGKQKVTLRLALSHLKTDKNSQAWAFFQPQIRINGYFKNNADINDFKVGEVWQFRVKLKRPHSSLNPGGFDYERYLFQQGVQANGYFFKSSPHLIETAAPSLRQRLAQHFDRTLPNQDFAGIYRALTIGDKQQMTDQQWQVLQTTGTIHLMAISGLHIGIIAGVGFALFAMVWKYAILWLNLRWLQHLPKIQFAAIGSLLFASAYMIIAGFSIPTQRAWLMVVAMLLFVFLRRRFQPWSALALAAFLVLIVDPKSVLATGFWLSFVAVAIIFAVIRQPHFDQLSRWQQFLAVQWWLTIGLIPALAFLYLQIPTTSLVANLVAVPVVSFVALPLLLLTTVITFLIPGLGDLWWFNDQLWQLLWRYLQWLSNSAHAQWVTGYISWVQLLLAYGLLFVVLWQPRPFLSLWIKSLITLLGFALILLASYKPPLEPGNFKVSVLDVGQAQAMVIETRHHLLVYDTGAQWTARLDGARMAILPYLKHQGIKRVDKLVVSHSDRDHAGGVGSLLAQTEISQAWSGQADKLNQMMNTTLFEPCYQGQKWQWDGVDFEILAPPRGLVAKNDNDASCILKVSNTTQSLMIPGDASKAVEKRLVESFDDLLKSNILIAGHHGSNTSTSAPFLEAVAPQTVIFTTGFQNRFKFPHKEVVMRIEKSGAKWLNTACSGSIHILVTTDGYRIQQQTRHKQSRWYHHKCPIEK